MLLFTVNFTIWFFTCRHSYCTCSMLWHFCMLCLFACWHICWCQHAKFLSSCMLTCSFALGMSTCVCSQTCMLWRYMPHNPFSDVVTQLRTSTEQCQAKTRFFVGSTFFWVLVGQVVDPNRKRALHGNMPMFLLGITRFCSWLVLETGLNQICCHLSRPGSIRRPLSGAVCDLRVVASAAPCACRARWQRPTIICSARPQPPTAIAEFRILSHNGVK